MMRLAFVLLIGGSLTISNLARGKDADQVVVDECVVRFASEIKVPSLETGRVAEVNVKQHDTIAAGAPIARLDDRSLLIRRRSASLRLNSAKSDAEDDVEIRYAEVALKEAEAELETSRSIQNDVRGAIPLSQIRKLRLAVERGQLEVAQAKKRRDRARLEAELREADLSEIDDELRNLHAESSIGGIVLEITRAAGEWVNKGEPIATIGRIDRLQVHALVDSAALPPSVCRGLPVSVLWIDDSTGQERMLRGNVLSVDPRTLPGGRFRLNAEIVNQPRGGGAHGWVLQPGDTVRMTVYRSATTAQANHPSHQSATATR